MRENAPACPKCGAKISGDAPQGLCPKCLLLQASSPTEATGSGARFGPEPPSIEALGVAFPQLDCWIDRTGRNGFRFQGASAEIGSIGRTQNSGGNAVRRSVIFRASVKKEIAATIHDPTPASISEELQYLLWFLT